MSADQDKMREHHAAESRRAVEALAESLYEANNADGVTWARRPRIVRDAWLNRARKQRSEADGKPSSGDASA